MSSPSKSIRQPHALYLILLGLFTAYLLIMTISTMRVPTVLTTEVPKESRVRRITYDYQVYPSPSILFPPGTGPLPAGRTSYFANVTRRIDFEVTGEIEVSHTADRMVTFTSSCFSVHQTSGRSDWSIVPTLLWTGLAMEDSSSGPVSHYPCPQQSRWERL